MLPTQLPYNTPATCQSTITLITEAFSVGAAPEPAELTQLVVGHVVVNVEGLSINTTLCPSAIASVNVVLPLNVLVCTVPFAGSMLVPDRA